jgi:hypothetical protein
MGAIAKAPISRDETLAIFGGWVIGLDEFKTLPISVQPYPYQIAEHLLYGPRCEDELSTGEYWNHSCNPNAGFSSETTLVAMKNIGVGEEITFDYAICMSSDIVEMPCNCGAEQCRELITADDWEQLDLQIRYKGYFQPYLQKKIGFGFLWLCRAALFRARLSLTRLG